MKGESESLRTSNTESPDDLRHAIENFQLSEEARAELAKYEPTQPSFELLTTLLP